MRGGDIFFSLYCFFFPCGNDSVSHSADEYLLVITLGVAGNHPCSLHLIQSSHCIVFVYQ